MWTHLWKTIWIASQFQKQAARRRIRASCPRETEDYGDPGETRDPGEVQSSRCLRHDQAIFMTTGRLLGKCKVAGVHPTNKLFLWQLEVSFIQINMLHIHMLQLLLIHSLHFHALSYSLKNHNNKKWEELAHTVKTEKVCIPYWGLNGTACQE